MRSRFLILLAASLLIAASACSVKKIAINSLADALAETSSVYATDNDLELVRDALPFGLKTIEALIVKAPRHQGLLVSAASGFTQYSYAFVQLDADLLQPSAPSRAREERLRAKALYLRAREYAFRALAVKHPRFEEELRRDPALALSRTKSADVPALYWLAASWAAAISSDKEDMDLVADLHLIEPIINRCLQLDEDYDNGALHDLAISFDGGRSQSQGGSIERARKHFEKARELSHGKRLSALISLAENVSVATENRGEFERLLQSVLAFDVNSAPEYRLANLIAQKRARFLLGQIDELFMN
ncbi:MAG: TRAP transporter TatT component family protein [Acidobacteriota bacterium]